MGELASEFAPALKLLLTKLFVAWWGSLDQAAKHNLFLLCARLAITLAIIASSCVIITVVVARGLRRLSPVVSDMPNIDETLWRLDRIFHRLLERLYAPWRFLSDQLTPVVFVSLILLLMAAFGSWPYNFYILMRFVVCGTFVWLLLLLHRECKADGWKVGLAAGAILFNPIAPFHWKRDVWQVWNMIAAASLLPAVVAYAAGKLKPDPPTREEVIDTPMAQQVKFTETKPSYRYCQECSRRVGKYDSTCKRCNALLDPLTS